MTADNGFSTKEMLIRLEAKMDTMLNQHVELVNVVTSHMADKHPETVRELAASQERENGRRDMLRILFGTSVIGAASGIIALVGMALGLG